MSNWSATGPSLAGRATTIAALAIIALTTLVFGRVLLNGWALVDDPAWLKSNPRLLPPSASNFGGYWTRPQTDLYTPLPLTIWGVIAAGAHFAGATPLPPWPFHAASLLSHALAAGTAYALLLRMTRAAVPAALGALVFALHPVQVEPVAWASFMKDVLMGLFGLLALERFMAARESGRGRDDLVALACCVLALLCKPQAVMLPVIAAVLSRTMYCTPWATLARRLSPWLIASIVFAIVARRAQSADYVGSVALHLRPVIAMDAIGFYLTKVAWPTPLAFDYGRRPTVVLAEPLTYFVSGVVLVLGAVALRYRRRAPLPVAGLAVFVLGTVPVLGLLPFDFQYFSTVGDHYLYLSMLGVGLGVAAMTAKYESTRLPVVGALVVLTCLTFAQIGRWKDPRTIADHTLGVNPRSFLTLNNWGSQLGDMGDDVGMEQYFSEALAINPQYAKAHDNLGTLQLQRRRYAEAVPHLRAALQYAPASKPQELLRIRFNLALALLGAGDQSEAAAQLRLVVGERPDYPNALRLLEQLTKSAAQSAHDRPTTRAH